jgi:hypothetical protein
MEKYSRYLVKPSAVAQTEADPDGPPAPAPGPVNAKDDDKKRDPDDYGVWFNKEQIVINGETFGWSETGVLLESEDR